MRTKRALALPAILTLFFAAGGCAEDASALTGTGDDGLKTGDRGATAESATPARPVEDAARAADGVAGDAVADALEAAGDAASRADAGEKKAGAERRGRVASGGEKVVLKMRGGDGARFAGACSAGGEDRKVGGRVPGRYVFESGAEKLSCEVRENGPETLRVVLEAGDDVRSVSQSGPGKSRINLTLSESGVSLTQSSSGSSRQAVQSGTSSQVQSSVVETR